jgi:hypothetical protein
MNDMTGCQHIRPLLGVYVLGAIDPAERSQVDAHLPGCAECREELAGLAGLPALLGRVRFDEAARIAGLSNERLPPGDPGAGTLVGPGDTENVVELAPLLDRMARRRRTNRWRGLVAAAAVVVVAAGTGIGVAEMAGGGASAVTATSRGHWDTATATDPTTHAKVVVRYTGMLWGTSLHTEVYGIPAGTTCEFWVLEVGGHKQQAGSWTVVSTWRDAWYAGSSSVPQSAVRGFEITSGNRVLVHINAT